MTKAQLSSSRRRIILLGAFFRYGPRISIRRDGGRADHDVHRRARDVRDIHDARDARVRPNKTDGSKLHRSDSD
jgi:hypothetical protein